MAKSRKQKKLEAKNKAEEKKFWQITIIVCAVLLVLLFISYLARS